MRKIIFHGSGSTAIDTGYSFPNLPPAGRSPQVFPHIINKRPASHMFTKPKQGSAVFLWLLTLLLSAGNLLAQEQSFTITGKVISAENQLGLAGVSVTIKGMRGGVTTDADGNFKLAARNGNVTLVFSHTGFPETEQAVNNRSVVNISLVAESKNLDDVVVIGYQTVKKRDLTGSVSSVNAKQLKDIPINSAAQALAGRLAGVQITGTEGTPNAEVTIRVRGGGSITQDNSPLYIIDGIQVENGLSAISPQDIQSIDVLKDASATAIYGARGANGVVIITTKGGKSNRTTISYNGLFGVNKLANKLDVFKPYDFVVYQYERSRGNSTDSTSFSNQYGTTWDTLSNYKNVPFTDWQDEMFGRSAFMQTHNVSLSGGNESTQFNLSLTSNTEEGIMLNSDFDRKLVNFKFDHSFSPSVKVGFATRYNKTTVNGSGTSNSTGSSSTNRLRHSVKYRPMLLPGQDIYDYDADYAAQTNANSLSLVNPILLNNAEYRNNPGSIVNLGGYVNINLTKQISFKTTLGYDVNSLTKRSFDDTITNNAKLNGGGMPLASINDTRVTTINNSNVFTYSNSGGYGNFAKRNDLTVLLGEETYQGKTVTENMYAKSFPLGISPERALGNMNLGTSFVDPSNLPTSEVESRILSFFGRVNYTFDKKYLFSVSMRADGSSKFAEDNRWNYFPSGSFAWRLSNEKFFDNLRSTVNDLKLRLSYGEAGNNRIGDFLYLQQFNSGTQYWLNDQLVTAYGPVSLANANLLWETTQSRNIGVDASFFNSRLQVSVDVYKNTTKNLLVGVPVPTTSGYAKQIQNVGSTENKGIEVQMNATPIQKRDFSWNINFNLSTNKNLVKSLGTYQNFYLENSGWGFSNTPADYIVRVGDPVGAMWGFTTDGYYTVNDFDYNSTTKVYTLKNGVPNNSAITSAVAPGAVKFKDIAGPMGADGKPTGPDGKIDDNDKSIIGIAQPKIFGGLNQQFTYKNFDFSIFLNYQFGNDVYNANKLEFTNGYTPNANMIDIMNERWRTIDATGKVVQRISTAGVVTGEAPEVLTALNANAKLWMPSTSSTSFVLHSWAVEDGSFVRINNITLGYSFNRKLISKIRMQTARIYVTVNNAAIITNYSGYDPEVNTRRNTPVTPGVDYSAYPRSRSFIAGINVSF